MRIDHIGYAVKDLNGSVVVFEELGFKRLGKAVLDPNRNVEIQLLENQGYVIELIAPAAEKSPIDNILKKIGCTPYHLCYKSENLESEIERLKKIGFVLIEKQDLAVALDMRRVCFLYHIQIGLLELVGK